MKMNQKGSKSMMALVVLIILGVLVIFVFSTTSGSFLEISEGLMDIGEEEARRVHRKFKYPILKHELPEEEFPGEGSGRIVTSCKSIGSEGEYQLQDSIRCSDHEPIREFSGTLDGRGHSIYGLDEPLFETISSSGTVKNIRISEVDIFEEGPAGGLSVENQGTIKRIRISGMVQGESNVGGLVGTNSGEIRKSSSTANVDGDQNVGVLVGQHTSGSVTNSYTVGSVEGISNVGGLIGSGSGQVDKTYAASFVTGLTNKQGLVGSGSAGAVTNSFWSTDTSGILPGDISGSVIGTPKVDEAMEDKATFVSTRTEGLVDPWDFDEIWTMG